MPVVKMKGQLVVELGKINGLCIKSVPVQIKLKTEDGVDLFTFDEKEIMSGSSLILTGLDVALKLDIRST